MEDVIGDDLEELLLVGEESLELAYQLRPHLLDGPQSPRPRPPHGGQRVEVSEHLVEGASPPGESRGNLTRPLGETPGIGQNEVANPVDKIIVLFLLA